MFCHGKTFSRNRRQVIGVSLLELCIVIAIIGILTMAALPFYTQYTIRTHRVEAEITLKMIAAQLEEFYTLHNSYAGVTLATLGIKDTQYYAFQLNSNEMEYTLIAEPVGTQASKDIMCKTLTLNSMGEIHHSGIGNVKECW